MSTGITNTVTVSIYLGWIIDIRAVVVRAGVDRVTRVAIDVTIEIGSGIADIAYPVAVLVELVGVVDIGTVVADVAGTIILAIFLTRVVVIGAVVAHVSRTVPVDIGLIGIAIAGTVVRRAVIVGVGGITKIVTIRIETPPFQKDRNGAIPRTSPADSYCQIKVTIIIKIGNRDRTRLDS